MSTAAAAAVQSITTILTMTAIRNTGLQTSDNVDLDLGQKLVTKIIMQTLDREFPSYHSSLSPSFLLTLYCGNTVITVMKTTIPPMTEAV